MRKTGRSYLELLCFQVKAAKELEENSNKIDSLLNWVASLEQKGELLEYRPHPIEQAPGVRGGTGPRDVPDGHVVGADSAAESLDEQYERLKVRTNALSLSKLSDQPLTLGVGRGVRWVWPPKHVFRVIFRMGYFASPCDAGWVPQCNQGNERWCPSWSEKGLLSCGQPWGAPPPS